MFADNSCSLSDEDLLVQYHDLRGQKVFREIYRRYKDPLFRYCAQMAPESCVEILETLWSDFLQSPPRLFDRTLKNWLYIQLNKMMQIQAVEEAKHTAVEGGTEDLAKSVSDGALRTAFEESEVLRTIQQLSHRQRNVLLLFSECQLSLATVADIEKITLAQCRQALGEGKQAMDIALHGAPHKPWKSTATLEKEAAAARDAEQHRDEKPSKPETSRPLFPWDILANGIRSLGSASQRSAAKGNSSNIAAATPAASDHSVEVV